MHKPTNGSSYVHDSVGAIKTLTDRRSFMSTYLYHIGIDVSKDTFDAGMFTSSAEPRLHLGKFLNSAEGLQQFQQCLSAKSISAQTAIVCVEATGVYSQLLCYHLHQANFEVCLEAPLKIKRAFPLKTHKTDAIDSLHIAEYAYRYCDRLVRWKPKSQLINHLETWLVLREQIVTQQTALINLSKALHKKMDAAELALKTCQKIIDFLTRQLDDIETEIFRLADQDPQIAQKVERLDAIPGIGKLTALNVVVITHHNPALTQYSKLAAYIGICPYQKESGKSLHKPARISQLGPPRMRKLLHLCARSLCTHNSTFRAYYLRKLNQGKPKKLVINNAANKLLRIVCAVLTKNEPFLKNYVSLNPKFS